MLDNGFSCSVTVFLSKDGRYNLYKTYYIQINIDKTSKVAYHPVEPMAGM
jgi:hypothetical protein